MLFRIVYYDGKIIRFCYKDYVEGKKISYMTLKVNTFIARLIRHIPDKNFPMIRYCGIFANRWKKQYIALARLALKQPIIYSSDKPKTHSWAERQMNYTGVNPLYCPNCNQELTLLGTVFGNWENVQYLFRKFGKDPYIPSPLFKPG